MMKNYPWNLKKHCHEQLLFFNIWLFCISVERFFDCFLNDSFKFIKQSFYMFSNFIFKPLMKMFLRLENISKVTCFALFKWSLVFLKALKNAFSISMCFLLKPFQGFEIRFSSIGWINILKDIIYHNIYIF